MKWNVNGYHAFLTFSLAIVNGIPTRGSPGWTTERKLHARSVSVPPYSPVGSLHCNLFIQRTHKGIVESWI